MVMRWSDIKHNWKHRELPIYDWMWRDNWESMDAGDAMYDGIAEADYCPPPTRYLLGSFFDWANCYIRALYCILFGHRIYHDFQVGNDTAVEFWHCERCGSAGAFRAF